MANYHSSFIYRESSTSGISVGGGVTVHVTNLAFSTTEEQLKQCFSAAGTVSKASIITRLKADEVLPSSVGRGFVEFSDAAGAIKAMEMLEGYELDGRRITVHNTRTAAKKGAFKDGKALATLKSSPTISEASGSKKGTEKAVSNRVFVQKLNWDTTDADFATLFASVGEVISAVIKKTKKGRSLGHGVVEYRDPIDAATAIESLNGQVLDGHTITVRMYV
jgi:RNA recognition motif-containing protein